MSFEAYLKHWLGNPLPINESGSKNSGSSEYSDLHELINTGIGGDTSNQMSKTSSFESIDTILSRIEPTVLQKVKTDPELQKILMAMLSPGKVTWLNEYITKSKKTLNNITSDKKKVDPSLNFDRFTRLTIKEADIKNKIYKMYLIFKYAEELPNVDDVTNTLAYIKSEGITLNSSTDENSPKYTIGKIGRVDNTLQSNEFEVIDDAGESKILMKDELKDLLDINPEIAEKAKEVTTESHRKKISKISQRVEGAIKKEVANSLNHNTDVINELPNDEATIEKLQVDWKPLLDALGYSKFYEAPIKKKESLITAKERPSIRRKNRIREKILSAIRLALLPNVANGEISEPGGDYFKLLKSIENNNSAWIESSIREVLVSTDRISQFNAGPRIQESSLEEDQLAYLNICSNWLIKYINSEVDGELSKRETDSAIARVKTITIEKEKEIKNYYLSKDFNMKNFKGIQLKPNLKLPLYTRIPLTVSEEDRIAESPLRNIAKGLSQIVKGLLSSVPLNINQALAEKNAAQNKAVFTGILSIIRGGTYAVSKQAGRNLDKTTEKIAGKENTPAKKVNEHDTGGVSPGTTMQVPGTMVDNNMDTLSLAGPGKKNKKTKKKSIIPKIASFKDFLKE